MIIRFFILISLLIFSNCSNDDTNVDQNTPISLKPSSYTVTESNGDNWTLNFEYSGNLISKITNDFGGTITYNYDGTRLVSFTSTGNGEK